MRVAKSERKQQLSFFMIKFVTINILELYKKGKDFIWDKPCSCPRCGSVVWGHGFVSGYLQGFSELLYFKRYRCPICGLILKLKPRGYLRFFRSSIHEIYRHLKFRFENARWPPGFSRQRGGHWINRFLKIYFRDSGLQGKVSILQALNVYHQQGKLFT